MLRVIHNMFDIPEFFIPKYFSLIQLYEELKLRFKMSFIGAVYPSYVTPPPPNSIIVET